MEEPLHLVLSDNLLYLAYHCCREEYQYMFPYTSGQRQSNFDSDLGRYVRNIWRHAWYRTVFTTANSPMYWDFTEDAFHRSVCRFRTQFTSPRRCFVLMVHVAMLAALFNKVGRKSARLWAFRIISRLARDCDIEAQTFNRARPVSLNLHLQN